MKRLSAQNQMYIAIALVVAVTLAVVFFGILPLFQESADLQEQIAAEETNLATAQALIERRQSAKAQSAANEVELMRIANQIPDSPQLPSVIIEIQDSANAANVELLQVAVEEVAPPLALADGTIPQYRVLPITVTMSGDWHEIIDFSRRLNNLDRGVRVVDSTYVYVPPADEEQAYVEGVVVLHVYMMEAASSTTTATVVPASQ